MKSRLTQNKTIITTQPSYAWEALYREDPKGKEILKSWLY